MFGRLCSWGGILVPSLGIILTGWLASLCGRHCNNSWFTSRVTIVEDTKSHWFLSLLFNEWLSTRMLPREQVSAEWWLSFSSGSLWTWPVMVAQPVGWSLCQSWAIMSQEHFCMVVSRGLLHPRPSWEHLRGESLLFPTYSRLTMPSKDFIRMLEAYWGLPLCQLTPTYHFACTGSSLIMTIPKQLSRSLSNLQKTFLLPNILYSISSSTVIFNFNHLLSYYYSASLLSTSS